MARELGLRSTITGYHLLCSGSELQQGRYMFDEDVTPLDAPSLIASGSTIGVTHNGERCTTPNVIFRDLLK